MNLKSKLLAVTITTLALITTTARAQQQPPAEVQGIWRYVDAQAVAVARLDLSTYDRAAFEKWLTPILNANTDPETAAAITQAMRDNAALDFPARLKQAGAKELLAVASLTDFPTSFGHLLIPLPQGADPANVARTLFEALGLTPDPAPANPQPNQPLLRSGPIFALTTPDGLLISAGDPARFANFPAAPRPDLSQALAGANGAPLAIALSPNEDTRKVVEQMLPQLPPPAGVPSTVLTRGLCFAHLAITLPPKQSLSVLIRSDTPEAARNFHDLATKLLGLLRQDQGFRQNVPAADQIVDAITPKLENNQITLTLDPAETDRVASLLAKGLATAREQALRVQSMSNLKQIGMGIMLYSNEHKGTYPDKLDQVAQYFNGAGPFKQVNTNPRFPKCNPAYTYIKPPTLMKDTPPDTAIAYESFDQWPGGIGVLFADGHVEYMADQNRVNEVLQKAKNPPPAK